MFRLILSIILTSLLAVSSYTLTAQTVDRCGTHEFNARQSAENPTVRRNRQAIEAATREYKKLRSTTSVITIPVVVHVVYSNPLQNIPDEQIVSQIRILNEDFRRMNADRINTPGLFEPVAADIELEFCLAGVDPQGNPTTGITRTPTTVTDFSFSDFAVHSSAEGGKDPWNPEQYLNIWVCQLEGGLNGYAQLPGGPAETDGAVVDYRYFGDIGTATAPRDLGRVATHEVGHYFNLQHTWGDGDCSVDDMVNDTPPAGAPNFTSTPCTFPGPNSCDTGAGDLPDMFMNYMDYSDDICMNMFTAGQKDRMRALLMPGGARYGLVTSSAACAPPICTDCDPPTCFDNIQNGDELQVDCGGSCAPCFCISGPIQLRLQLDDFPEETRWKIIDADYQTVITSGDYSQNSGELIVQDIDLPLGTYVFLITDVFNDGIFTPSFGPALELLNNNGEVLFSIPTNGFDDISGVRFCVEDPACPYTLVLAEDPISSATYASADAVIALAPLAANADVTLQGNTVSLLPGFSAAAGTTLSVVPQACVPTDGPTQNSVESWANVASRTSDMPDTKKDDRLLNVFPNPTSGELEMTWTTSQPGAYFVRVTTLLGQTVYEWNNATELMESGRPYRQTINLRPSGPGMYFVTLHGPSGRVTRSVLVQ